MSSLVPAHSHAPIIVASIERALHLRRCSMLLREAGAHQRKLLGVTLREEGAAGRVYDHPVPVVGQTCGHKACVRLQRVFERHLAHGIATRECPSVRVA